MVFTVVTTVMYIGWDGNLCNFTFFLLEKSAECEHDKKSADGNLKQNIKWKMV